MNKRHSKHELARVWPAVAIMAIWLAGTAGGLAADAPPMAGNGASADTAVLLDEDTVWRHLHLEGPSFFLLDDPKVTSLSGVRDSQVRRTQCVQTAAGTMAKVGLNYAFVNNSTGCSTPVDWPSEATSLPPPFDWASVTFDDSAWMRAYWPQPLADTPYTEGSRGHIVTSNILQEGKGCV